MTRPKEQAGPLVKGLQSLGAEVFLAPVIRIEGPEDPSELAWAAKRLSEYDWVVFTSANGVRALWKAVEEQGLGRRDWQGVRIAAIGPATTCALAERGLQADLVAPVFRGESLVESMTILNLRGRKVLFPHAKKVRDVVARGLRQAGAIVDEVIAYATVPEAVEKELLVLMGSKDVDAVTFTSPSSVHSLARAYEQHGLTWPMRTKCFCLGPITAEAARTHGLEVAGVASEYTISGLLDALVNHFRDQRPMEV